MKWQSYYDPGVTSYNRGDWAGWVTAQFLRCSAPMMYTPLALLTAVGTLWTASAACAETVVSSPVERDRPSAAEAQTPARYRHGVFANLGAFSTVGFAGITYTYSPRSNVVLESGVGYGASGLQFSFMPKLRVGSGHHRLLLGVGPSVGVNPEDGAVSYWITGDVGYEFQAAGGFTVALVAGIALGVAGCIEATCRASGGTWGDDTSGKSLFGERADEFASPQARLIIGYQF